MSVTRKAIKLETGSITWSQSNTASNSSITTTPTASVSTTIGTPRNIDKIIAKALNLAASRTLTLLRNGTTVLTLYGSGTFTIFNAGNFSAGDSYTLQGTSFVTADTPFTLSLTLSVNEYVMHQLA